MLLMIERAILFSLHYKPNSKIYTNDLTNISNIMSTNTGILSLQEKKQLKGMLKRCIKYSPNICYHIDNYTSDFTKRLKKQLKEIDKNLSMKAKLISKLYKAIYNQKKNLNCHLKINNRVLIEQLNNDIIELNNIRRKKFNTLNLYIFLNQISKELIVIEQKIKMI